VTGGFPGDSCKDMGVRYHDDGSKKLNACILFLSHMVYLLFRITVEASESR
jgi:hypothetical protein